VARRKFSKEFKAEAVALVLERGLSASQVARDLGVGQPTISRWVKAAAEAASPGALSTAEREELRRLREETKTLRMERDILKKAAAFFAKEM
jgi:transposase